MPTRDELLAEHDFTQSDPRAFSQGIYAPQPDGSRKILIGLYYTEGHDTIYLSFNPDDRSKHFPGNITRDPTYKHMTTNAWLDWVEAFVQAWVDDLGKPTTFAVLTTTRGARYLLPRGFTKYNTIIMMTKPFTPKGV